MNVKFSLTGLILIAIGIMLLLGNLNLYRFDWEFILKLWPIILILFGLKFIFGEKGAGWFSIITVGVLIVFLFVIDALGLNNSSFLNQPTTKTQVLSEEYNSTTEQTSLSLNLGAGNFNIADVTDKLITANSETTLGEYVISKTDSGNKSDLSLKLNTKRKFWLGSFRNTNNLNISLNANPVWTIDTNAGASSIDFDLSKYKISNANFNLGASSTYVKFGNLSPDIKSTFDAGASKIVIDVPKDSGCEAIFDTGATSKTMNGFDKIDDKTYRTSNFDSAKNKIYLKFKAGASSLEIDRY